MEPTSSSEKHQRLETLWTEFLSKSPTIHELLDVVASVPALTEKAWKKYCETNPSEQNLRNLIISNNWSDRPIQSLPVNLLMERHPTRTTYEFILRNCPNHFDAAAEKIIDACTGEDRIFWTIFNMCRNIETKRKGVLKLLSFNPSKETLRELLGKVPDLNETIGTKLFEKDPSENSWNLLIRYAPSLRVQIWYLIQKNGCTTDTLMAFIHTESEYSEPAARMLLSGEKFEKHPHILLEILRYVPSLQEEAWKKYETIEIPNNLLGTIAEVSPELAVRARARQTVPERTTEIIRAEMLALN